MTKGDLRARPVFHHLREAIEAHLTVVFASLAVAPHLHLAATCASPACGDPQPVRLDPHRDLAESALAVRPPPGAPRNEEQSGFRKISRSEVCGSRDGGVKGL